MSKEIDERVVSLEFDNSRFNDNAKGTMSILDKLKASLNFGKVTNSVDNLGKKTGTAGILSMGNAVDQVSAKFSVMQVAAYTAISNITNSAMNAGKRIVKSLTVDPIKSGLQEYETQLNSVQTILANTSTKGSTLKDVNAALDELNRYADKTIYNFTEMTRNIGKIGRAHV